MNREARQERRHRVSRSAIAGVLVVAFAYAPAVEAADWTTALLGPHRRIAVSQTNDVAECSGMVASRTNPGIFWVHNDSGNGHPRVYAIRLTDEDRKQGVARDMGWVELRGASDGDWEDIASGPEGSIYVFDGGDNRCRRKDKRIHRFREPVLAPGGPKLRLPVACESILIEYPDAADATRPTTNDAGRFDAECLLVHPLTGDIYVVTKRDAHGTARARVYMLPSAAIRWGGADVHVLRFVLDLSAVVPSMVTGGDIDSGGKRVVLRNYLSAYEFRVPPGGPFDAAFRERPQQVSLFGEPQGEAICYSADGSELITACEAKELGLKRFPIYAVPAPTPPAATAPTATSTAPE